MRQQNRHEYNDNKGKMDITAVGGGALGRRHDCGGKEYNIFGQHKDAYLNGEQRLAVGAAPRARHQ